MARKGKNLAEKGGTRSHCRTLIVIDEDVAPEAGEKLSVAVDSGVGQTSAEVVDESGSGCDDSTSGCLRTRAAPAGLYVGAHMSSSSQRNRIRPVAQRSASSNVATTPDSCRADKAEFVVANFSCEGDCVVTAKPSSMITISSSGAS